MKKTILTFALANLLIFTSAVALTTDFANTVFAVSSTDSEENSISLVLIGVTIDSKSLQPAEGIKVELYEGKITNSNAQSYITKKDGSFYFKLEKDKTYYVLAKNAKNIEEDRKIIVTDNKNKSEIIRTVMQVKPQLINQANTAELAQNATVTPAPVTGSSINAPAHNNLSFKIQIGAYKQRLSDKSSFYTQIEKEYAIETETSPGGYIRYMVGPFSDFKQAKAAEKKLQEMDYKKAFIVLYKDSKRQSISSLEMKKLYDK